MRFRREPLSDLCAAALRPGFVSYLLVEPTPAESMRDRHPEASETLSREPALVVLSLHMPARQSATVVARSKDHRDGVTPARGVDGGLLGDAR